MLNDYESAQMPDVNGFVVQVSFFLFFPHASPYLIGYPIVLYLVGKAFPPPRTKLHKNHLKLSSIYVALEPKLAPDHLFLQRFIKVWSFKTPVAVL